VFSLKVSEVERSNIQVTLLDAKSAEHGTSGSAAGGNQDRVRMEKIRVLKETFLRERPSSP
jgi:hypothetical protein